MPAELIHVHNGRAIWRLSVPAVTHDVLVMVDGAALNDDWHIVHVDADAFYVGMMRSTQVLRTSKHGNTCMARQHMSNDYKFHYAIEGFACSASSPVPVAQPAIGLDHRGNLRVDFVDGMTRTYWLLANNCRSFPVEVHGQAEAQLLADRAGVGMTSFAELFALGESEEHRAA